jgi:uncharacterized membrane protein YebE (DUF533 family)
MPIDKLLKNPQAQTALTGALSGAAGGALVSAFTNKKSAKKLLKGAGLVAVGGLAWQAYQSYRNGSQQAAAEEITRQEFEAVVAPEAADTASVVLQAMIAAAHADGMLSEAEQGRIWQHALEIGLPSAQLDSLQSQLASPQSVQQLAASCQNMATKIDVYTASALLLEDTCNAGRVHLNALAAALQLPAPLVSTLNQQSGYSSDAASDQAVA